MFLMEIIENAILNADNTWHITDLDLHSNTCGIDVYLFWHDSSCSLNLNWYPIIQIEDDEGNMIKWKEGPENSLRWLNWIEEMLKEYSEADDWWYIR